MSRYKNGLVDGCSVVGERDIIKGAIVGYNGRGINDAWWVSMTLTKAQGWFKCNTDYTWF